MTSLTITPDPVTGSHRLTITPTATVTRIRRTDANGTTDVRTLAGVLPRAGTDPFDLDDYEAANGLATYAVSTAAGTVTGSATLVLGVPWLGLPITPQFSARAQAITGYGADIESRSTVVDPDGAMAPIVITSGSSTRRGSLEVWAGSYAAGLALLRLIQRGQVILLRQTENAGMDMYFTASRASLVTLMVPQDKPAVFGIRLDYIEVARPAGPLAGAIGWTWGALKNAYATWGDVAAAYATWGDVRTNRKITS